MGRVVEQERSEREGREETHKNELRLVEEILNGRYMGIRSSFSSALMQDYNAHR